jgi:hypothetical protein
MYGRKTFPEHLFFLVQIVMYYSWRNALTGDSKAARILTTLIVVSVINISSRGGKTNNCHPMGMRKVKLFNH